MIPVSIVALMKAIMIPAMQEESAPGKIPSMNCPSGISAVRPVSTSEGMQATLVATSNIMAAKVAMMTPNGCRMTLCLFII